MSDRGMKKWAPFNALESQQDEVHKIIQEKQRVPFPTLSDEQIEEINYFLSTYDNEECIIQFYYDGFIKIIQGTIIKIDINNKFIKTLNHKIPLDKIISLKK